VSAPNACSECGNPRLAGAHCLAHLSDSEFGLAANNLRGGAALVAKDVDVSARTLRRVLRLARGDGDAPISSADFDNARFFGGSIHFERAHFLGKASFRGATFGGDAHFDDATFSRYATSARRNSAGRAISAGCPRSRATSTRRSSSAKPASTARASRKPSTCGG
jgi:hypothetical protein